MHDIFMTQLMSFKTPKYFNRVKNQNDAFCREKIWNNWSKIKEKKLHSQNRLYKFNVTLVIIWEK